MRLQPITNMKQAAVAVGVARTIFPYEMHRDGRFDPEISINYSVTCKEAVFRYYLAYHGLFLVGLTGHYQRHLGSKFVWLGWFGILPQFRGRGLGKEMLRKTTKRMAAIDRVQELKIMSGTRKEEHNAHVLYLSVGFEHYLDDWAWGEQLIYFRAKPEDLWFKD